MKQQSNRSSRARRNLPERNVLFILVNRRKHVACWGAVRVIILKGRLGFVVVCATDWVFTFGALGNLHRLATFADEEARTTNCTLVPMGLELPDILSSLQQCFHDSVPDIFVHALSVIAPKVLPCRTHYHYFKEVLKA